MQFPIMAILEKNLFEENGRDLRSGKLKADSKRKSKGTITFRRIKKIY